MIGYFPIASLPPLPGPGRGTQYGPDLMAAVPQSAARLPKHGPQERVLPLKHIMAISVDHWP